MRRLLGLLLIVRALAPVLMVLVLVWGLGDMIGDLRAALVGPVAEIHAQVETARAAVETAKQQFETVRADITALLDNLRRFHVPDFLPDLPDNLTFPRIDIPDFDIPIPTGVDVTWSDLTATISDWIPDDCPDWIDWLCEAGRWVTRVVTIPYPSDVDFSFSDFRVRFPNIPTIRIPMPDVFGAIRDGLGGLFSGFGDLFGEFDAAFARLRDLGDSLRALPDTLNEAWGQARALYGGVQDVLVRWGVAIAAALVIIGVLMAIYYVVPFLDDFTRGWRMLFGPPPGA